ncbi:MAG TPA: polysaccharide biosynthesis C-terminal domain-containing protein [Chitinophagaceae bacterium]|nr:polysaccharide biosynthesis C-terminal domain-containing protein [Chitinophagaceae bacterium]
MSGIKKLAGQTLWYGVPTIASRFLGYLMNLSLPFIFKHAGTTADLTQVYAIVPFLNVLFTYGMETAYFRFSQSEDKKKLYSTLTFSIFITTILFTAVLLFFRSAIADAAGLEKHPQYVTWMCWIIFFDTLATLPFAKLRQEGRPRKYAFVRVAGILMNILVVILFLGVIPDYVKKNPDGFINIIYDSNDPISFYLLGNVCGSIFTFLLLWKEFKGLEFNFNTRLWKKVMEYSYPLIIVGLGGMINDMLSRLVYRHVVDVSSAEADKELGIFGNLYRLAVLVTVMIQAFRMAAEPFFFNRSTEENPQRIYARVMKFFVIACCFMFLFIGLYRDVLEWVITLKSKEWGEGIYIVPILALGNIFLGIYYNLSIWYKLTNKNMTGAMITFVGAVITVALNIILIPKLHYLGAAIATFSCYLFMMVISYVLGQKYYPVPYAKKKLISYLVLVVLIYLAHRGLLMLYNNLWFSIGSATILLLLFAFFVAKIEKKELQKLPYIGKYFVPGVA